MGYPKTATSTIQDALLYQAHMKGYIHFLGRSRFLKDNYKYERIVNIANNHNESINNYYNDLSDDLLNVISDEGLTLIYYRHLEGDVISKNTKFVLNISS